MIARIKRLNSLKKDVLFIYLLVSVNTVYDWFQRTSISFRWFLVTLKAAQWHSDNMFTRGVRKKKFNTASNWAKFKRLSHILCYAAVLYAKQN